MHKVMYTLDEYKNLCYIPPATATPRKGSHMDTTTKIGLSIFGIFAAAYLLLAGGSVLIPDETAIHAAESAGMTEVKIVNRNWFLISL